MKRRTTGSRQTTRGFTLLELLVATAVGAIVLLVIQTTFFGALRLHLTTHTRIDNDLVLQRALAIVRRDFSGLMLPGGTLAGPFQTTTFSTSAQGVDGERISPDIFTNSGKIDGWNPFSEIQMVAYYLAPATDGSGTKDLVRAVTRNLLPIQDATVDTTVLLHGVTTAVVEFYDGFGWIDAWDSTVTSSVPTALKLTLEMGPRAANGAANGPIELLVPVMVMTAASQAEAAVTLEP